MKAPLDGIYSIDLPNGPPQMPEDPSDCWVVVQAEIGQDGRLGAETFTFYVTTPKHIAREPASTTRHTIVMERFNWDEVETHIRARCSAATGQTWAELARSIGGDWRIPTDTQMPMTLANYALERSVTELGERSARPAQRGR